MSVTLTASPSLDRTVELPRPWRLVCAIGWSLAEAAGLPLGACPGRGHHRGHSRGLAATWLAVVVRKLATGQGPGLLMLSAAMLCLQAALVFATGQAWIYLLQFPLAKLVLSLLLARSAPTGQPLIARLAAEMTSLRQNCQENSGLHRCFRGVTWLWAGISRLLAVIFAVLVATVPIASFLLISCLAVTGTGAAASALWFFAVLLRHGLRFRLAPG